MEFNEFLQSVWAWIVRNKEVLLSVFSGIGVFVLAGILKLFWPGNKGGDSIRAGGDVVVAKDNGKAFMCKNLRIGSSENQAHTGGGGHKEN